MITSPPTAEMSADLRSSVVKVLLEILRILLQRAMLGWSGRACKSQAQTYP